MYRLPSLTTTTQLVPTNSYVQVASTTTPVPIYDTTHAHAACDKPVAYHLTNFVSYPTSYMTNTLVAAAPSTVCPPVVYESRVAEPVYSNCLHLPPIKLERSTSCCSSTSDSAAAAADNCCQCCAECEEKRVNGYIKERVDEQIKKFQLEQLNRELVAHQRKLDEAERKHNDAQHEKARIEQQKLAATMYVCSDCVDHVYEQQTRNGKADMSFDTKLKLIRDELNQIEANRKEKRRPHECHCCMHTASHAHSHSKCKYTANVVNGRQSRSRSTSRRRHSSSSRSASRSHSCHRSKSPASRRASSSSSSLAYRPPWMPVGSNDYTQTQLHREQLARSDRFVSADSPLTKQSSSGGGGKHKETRGGYFYVTTITPAKTIIKTTVESRAKVK